MKRIFIVYNPRSSRFADVRKEVIGVVQKMKGVLVGKYEVLDTNVDDNARRLAGILKDEDLVVAAGGDGTVNIAVNGVMLSGKKAVLAVLPYGNFNDTAMSLGTKKLEDVLGGEVKRVWPLEAIVDGAHFRYAISYFTMGLLAEACAVFDGKKMRKKLQVGRKPAIYSWLVLARWYFGQRKKRGFLPKFRLNGALMPEETTDVMVVNGRRVAGLMKGVDAMGQKREFLLCHERMGSILRLLRLMVKSIFRQVPGEMREECVMEFLREASFEIQAEGEYVRLEGVKKLEIRKAKQSLSVIGI